MGKHGGKRNKSRGDMPFVDNVDVEAYVCVTHTMGCGRFQGVDVAGAAVQLKIKGSLYKRAWVNRGAVCLATRRPGMSGATMDIVWVYQPEEIKVLKRYGEINAAFDSGVVEPQHQEDQDAIVFADDDDAAIDAV